MHVLRNSFWPEVLVLAVLHVVRERGAGKRHGEEVWSDQGLDEGFLCLLVFGSYLSGADFRECKHCSEAEVTWC